MAAATCLNCEEKIYGRSDKKFCSPDCRNEYNNALNRDDTNYMRRVNRLLRKNRHILKDLNPKGKSKTTQQKLAKVGFNFNYFTSTYETRSGNQYFFCYDQGYLKLDNGWLALVEKQEYTD